MTLENACSMGGEVRGIGRQEEEVTLPRGEGLVDAERFVSAQLIEHDPLSRSQPRG